MKGRLPWILFILGAVLVGGTLVLINCPLSPLLVKKFHCEIEIQTALKRNRPRFEGIVKAVEKQGLSEDQSARYFFPKEGAPDQLRKVDQSFDRHGLGQFCERNTLVQAYRRKGVLFVKVVICEMGHAGTYAVMYSSKALTQKEIEDQLVPCAVENLDPHWWAVVEWY